MKITSFNPLIITTDPASTIALFESLGFEKRHAKEGIGIHGVTDVRMRNKDGFHVDISSGDSNWTMIRINVDDLDEAIAFLEQHGFRSARHDAAKETVETGSSRFKIMVSPTGYILNVSQHIKDED